MMHESHDGAVGFSLRPLPAIVEGGSISISSLRHPEISFWFNGDFVVLSDFLLLDLLVTGYIG